jgi:hypothetical protein
MQRHAQYIMCDQVTDRVVRIMGERPRRPRGGAARAGRRPRWLALIALAVSTVALSLAHGPFG